MVKVDDGGIFGIILVFIIFTSAIATVYLGGYEGFCSDFAMPKGAIEFAYDHMTIKENITFTKIQPNMFENYCERHYWVTDTGGYTYRLVWSKMHHEIELNKSYRIQYLPGTFNALWGYE
jgi:hypothetical protein